MMTWFLPPVFVGLALIVMIAHAWVSPGAGYIAFPYYYLGLILAVFGLAITVGGARRFASEKTNINTFRNPDKLVVAGVFKYSRNPMYVGFVLLLLGVAIALNTLYYLVFPLLFFLLANYWYIPFEEQRMHEAFGAEYEAYKARVRRWI